MQITRETDHLVRLTRFGMFNCFLVKEGNEFTLVDTNLPGSSDEILRAAAALGSPVSRIVLTHAHFDHVGSLDALTTALPDAEVCTSKREARLLHGDFGLPPGETGKPLVGFKRAQGRIHKSLNDGDQVGALRVVAGPGHSPGHLAFLDSRDCLHHPKGRGRRGRLQPVLPHARVVLLELRTRSCQRSQLAALKPSRVAVGHGPTIASPAAKMDEAVQVAFRQHPSEKRA